VSEIEDNFEHLESPTHEKLGMLTLPENETGIYMEENY
jgi:hypothetical protein